MKFLLIYPPIGATLAMAPHVRTAIEECGHQVEIFDFSKIMPLCMSRSKTRDLAWNVAEELLIKKALEVKPDIFLDIMPCDKKTIRRLKAEGIITCLWFVESGYEYSYWRDAAFEYDFFFYIQPGRFIEEVAALGVKNAMYLPHGCNPKIHRRLSLSETEQRIYGSDLSFLGEAGPDRAEAFGHLKDYDIKIWGGGWNKFLDKRWGIEDKIMGGKRRVDVTAVTKIFNASSLNLNLHAAGNIRNNFQGDFANARTFSLAGCGAFQLVDKREAISLHFKIDEEIVCFSTIEELKEKIDYYLAHPEEREEIAKAAQERAYKEHTYAHRIEEMVEFIRIKYFGENLATSK